MEISKCYKLDTPLPSFLIWSNNYAIDIVIVSFYK